MNKPVASLGVPVFNGEAYLEECLSSLVAQPREDVEIVISDNASTDTTEEICRSFAASDNRVVYLRHEENRGAAWNYNECVRESRGEFFSWTAHDDLRSPDFVDVSLTAFAEVGPDYAVVASGSEFIDHLGATIGPDTDTMPARSNWPFVRLGTALAHVNFAAPVFGMIRRDMLDKTRLIGPFVASDYVLICELAMLGKIAEVDEVLFYRRLHTESSREANSTDEEVQNWFDPHSEARGRSARSNLLREYQQSVGNVGLSGLERGLCRATVPSVIAARRARVAVGRWRRRLVCDQSQAHARDVMAAESDQRNNS